MVITTNNNLVQNTTHKVVLPFYLYAAISFLAATVLLFISGKAFTQHYFHPNTLAITHTMALGWGTMMILGASHQLLPVLTDGKLYSTNLAYVSFGSAATGIPLLVTSFFHFDFSGTAQAGGILINAAILCFVVNAAMTISKSKSKNVHAVFVLTASLWLFATTVVGLLLVFNFTTPILPANSLHYLSLHAHIGIAGWFLLIVMGVGSRLIPMFLISKYDNPKRLWLIYFLVNGSLTGFIVFFFSGIFHLASLLLLGAVLFALILFANYCYHAYKQRIRKHVDQQVKISLLSTIMLLLPFVFLLVLVISVSFSYNHSRLSLAYGFTVFFGWLTAIILGMTFKTLPFIVWNKVYHGKAGLGKTPNPKDLFSENIFNKMVIAYILGFCLFITGELLGSLITLQTASLLLIITAVLFNVNVLKLLLHKPVSNE
jgi:hypothetical protein